MDDWDKILGDQFKAYLFAWQKNRPFDARIYDGLMQIKRPKVIPHEFVPIRYGYNTTSLMSYLNANSHAGLCGRCGRVFYSFEGVWPVHEGIEDRRKNVNYQLSRVRSSDLAEYEDDEEYEEAVDVSPWGKKGSKAMPFNQLSDLLQRARHDHNLLDQDEVWVNAKGLKITLGEMSARYAHNILSSMRQRAKLYHSAWATWEFITKYADQDATDLEELMDNQITDAKAKEWIKETKLYKALLVISKKPV